MLACSDDPCELSTTSDGSIDWNLRATRSTSWRPSRSKRSRVGTVSLISLIIFCCVMVMISLLSSIRSIAGRGIPCCSVVTTINKFRHGDGDSILFIGGSYIPSSCLHFRPCVLHGNRNTCDSEHTDIDGTVPDRHHAFGLHPQEAGHDRKS